MSGDQETLASQRARRAAGWREVAFYVPEQDHARIGQLASTYRLCRTYVMQTSMSRGLAVIGKQEWYQRGKAPKVRLTRRDAGLCRECRARLKVGAEAQQQYQARKRAGQGDGNAPEPPATHASETKA